MTNRINISIKAGRPALFDERQIRYDAHTVADIPPFRESRFAREFILSPERLNVNVILALCAALSLDPAQIDHVKPGFKVRLTSGRTIGAEIKIIMTDDDFMSERIGEISAGLNEWIVAQQVPGLAGRHVVVTIPDLKAHEPDHVFRELKGLLGSPGIATLPLDQTIGSPAKYSVLADLGATLRVSRSPAARVSVTRGESRASVSAGMQLVVPAMATARDLRKDIRGIDEAWLVLWFASLANIFSLESARREIESMNALPFDKAFVTDNSQIAEITNLRTAPSPAAP